MKDQLRSAIQTLIEAKSVQDVMRAIQSHPILYEEEGINAISETVISLRNAGRERIAYDLETHLRGIQLYKMMNVPIDMIPHLMNLTKPNPEPEVPPEASSIEENQELQDIFEEIARLNSPAEMPRKIELCHQGLHLINKQENSKLWAALNVELANALTRTPVGNQADNLEDAIQHYEAALGMDSQDALSESWAVVHNNLAFAYLKRISGEPAENLERTIEHYKVALRVYTKEAFPERWATINSNLGNAYSNRIHGDRVDNFEEAIRLFKEVLEVHTRSLFPEEWAMAHYNLGIAYWNRVQGGRAENLEEAIRHYLVALEVYTREAFPQRWAACQHNLAIAYRNRIHGERADNLDQAIEHLVAVLEIDTREKSPTDWAMTQNSLANAYSDRIHGERAENQEKAIQRFHNALEVYTREAFPIDWAVTQNNLGATYLQRIRGNRAENLEQTIKHCLAALEVNIRETVPEKWAMTQNNLGEVYRNRVHGERTENLEQAIRHQEAALEVYNVEMYPVEWAQSKNNLGTAYADRIRGNHAENLEIAIQYFEEALNVFTRESFPERWANTENNLGTIFWQRIYGERADNLEQAIKHGSAALEVFKFESYPEQWAMAQSNLAGAYSIRIHGDHAENLERAIEYYQAALKVYGRESLPQDWAMTQNNMGEAYRKRIRGERMNNLEQATKYYEAALEVYKDIFPFQQRNTARFLGDTYALQENWFEAQNNYNLAIHAAEQLFRASVSPVGQSSETRELADLYDLHIIASQHLGASTSVLIASEAARSRIFLKQLGLGEFSPPVDIPSELIARESATRSKLRDLEELLAGISSHSERASDSEREHVQKRSELLNEMDKILDAMVKATPSVRDYVALRRGDTPSWDELQRLAIQLGKDAALVEFHNLVDHIVAIIWRAGWDTPHLVVIPLGQSELIRRYLLSYEREIINRHVLQAAGSTPGNDWQRLGDVLLAPLEPALGDSTLVYFVPHGNLHLIPLHALTINGEPFIAKHAVAYAPSAASLARTLDPTHSKSNPSQGNRVLVMGEVFVQEAIELAEYFGVTAFINTTANRTTLEERAPSASVIHLSCHGNFNSDDALASAVELADGAFTAREWMRLGLNADLVTLSACQLGFSELNPGDDLIGMARALMYAGASSLLLTLWSVRADTTKDWMLDFYKRVWKSPGADKSQPKAYAVRDAMLALRGVNPDPYIWAPFVLIGDWR